MGVQSLVRVAIVGTGYVGLTTGLVFAYLGNEVTCVDIDKDKIALLKKGKLPIYEPHADRMLAEVVERIRFTSAYEETVPQADAVFITVGTPAGPDGRPVLTAVEQAARAIGEHLGSGFTVVVNKSTVPLGTGNWVRALVRDAFEARNGHRPDGCYAVVSNPEFLREGSALQDSFYPDRVVLGVDDPRALEIVKELYRPILEQNFNPPTYLPRPEGFGHVPLVVTDLASAELIKYAANAFLAMKISFINELARLAERVGADIRDVARGIGLDRRIGPGFLQAGIGWGGSCFGKDTAALLAMAHEHGVDLQLAKATRQVNYRVRLRVVEKLAHELKILKGRTIGLLGLAFKPHTDDLRDAPAYDIARVLVERGARVKTHDPVVVSRARREWDLAITYCEDPREVFRHSDGVILVTEWPEYLRLPWDELVKEMSVPLVVDGRNVLDGRALMAMGFRYVGVGH